jgi:hypothetical protein
LPWHRGACLGFACGAGLDDRAPAVFSLVPYARCAVSADRTIPGPSGAKAANRPSTEHTVCESLPDDCKRPTARAAAPEPHPGSAWLGVAWCESWVGPSIACHFSTPCVLVAGPVPLEAKRRYSCPHSACRPVYSIPDLDGQNLSGGCQGAGNWLQMLTVAVKSVLGRTKAPKRPYTRPAHPRQAAPLHVCTPQQLQIGRPQYTQNVKAWPTTANVPQVGHPRIGLTP